MHPTRASIHLAAAAGFAALVGVSLQSGPILGFGGAILLALGIARAVTEVSVTKIRCSGFEMLWRHPENARRMLRGQTVELEGELLNRDSRAARYVGLRAIASPELHVLVTPEHGEVPAGGRLRVDLQITALRVGRHALHGLSLEVQAGPGLFEVPLTFANPYGLEVLPNARLAGLLRAHGSPSRNQTAQGRTSPLAGEGGELRELRRHQAGDPFRRIAWKASARRGELLVREYEQDQRQVVFLLIDAAVELSSGHPGQAALDRVLDEVAAAAIRHSDQGDPVGFAVVGRRVLTWVPPKAGAAQGRRIVERLALATTPVQVDRSALDPSDLALRVLEHMRPLSPELASRVRPDEIERIARRADRLRSRAPFPDVDVEAASPEESSLRRYLEAFGIGSPLRLGPDRAEADAQLARALDQLRLKRPRPSLVLLWTPVPEPGSRSILVDAVRRLRSRRTELVWMNVPLHAGLDRSTARAEIVADALTRRADLEAGSGEAGLRRLGIRVQRMSLDSPRAP